MKNPLIRMISFQIEIAAFEDTEELIRLLESVEETTDDIDPDFTMFFIARDEEKSKIIACVGLIYSSHFLIAGGILGLILASKLRKYARIDKN